MSLFLSRFHYKAIQQNKLTPFISLSFGQISNVCVCVCEREREQYERKENLSAALSSFLIHTHTQYKWIFEYQVTHRERPRTMDGYGACV
jgi:hypothetical protein